MDGEKGSYFSDNPVIVWGKSEDDLSIGSVISGLTYLTKDSGELGSTMTSSSIREEVIAEGNSLSTGTGSQVSVQSGRSQTLWDRTTSYSIDDVYRINIVETEDKETVQEIGTVMSQTIFPKLKFLINWDKSYVPHNDRTKDEGYLHVVFDRLGWNYRQADRLYIQAIKWNTYRNVVKSQFNSTKATRIALVKKELVAGKLFLLSEHE